ncbi:ribosomal protein S12 methylthiotransferase RimO [Ruminiclostridium hungatei]|uniref:Ribosomal protein S12 methylthiotransferase RimO n=1 Tax=Ruminiclostridium hungatei TaxID=48256 RepID=A0A1V4SJ65_RUMHU|nr:RCCLKC-tail radical SAM protein [Ruminiclostridium hungatei]OPX43928.1 ribosomal protein S12 methylthiotransferase RimO [Ruminiclostridium hungatei]
MFKILLVSTFEGGFQPLTVATALTALERAKFDVSVIDTYIDGMIETLFLEPDLIAISVPLFDALRLGVDVAKKVRKINSKAHITFFGQYATLNATRLVDKYGDTCIVGEWERTLTELAYHLSGSKKSDLKGIVNSTSISNGNSIEPLMCNDHFDVPSRHLLPPLSKYPQAQINKLLGKEQVVGGTEIARGCHHKCQYCSVYGAYNGKVLVIPEAVVIEDVRNMVVSGMTHLTFMDADFFNTKYHGINIIRKLHSEFPQLTYDFTARVDHILENKETVMEMAQLGVKFIVSSLEFHSQEVLDAVSKELTVEAIQEVVEFLHKVGIKLSPTFIMFNPWTSLEDLVEFSKFVEDNNLDDIIDPIQYETRLHLYKGSPLLSTPSIKALELVENEFNYEWKHPDFRVDEVFSQLATPPEEGVFKRCCLKC